MIVRERGFDLSYLDVVEGWQLHEYLDNENYGFHIDGPIGVRIYISMEDP